MARVKAKPVKIIRAVSPVWPPERKFDKGVIAPNQRYRVWVNRQVQLGKAAHYLSPRVDNVVTGVMLQALPSDAIDGYEVV